MKKKALVLLSFMLLFGTVKGKMYTLNKNTTIGPDCVRVETWIYEDHNDTDPSNDDLLAHHVALIGKGCTGIVVDPEDNFHTIEIKPNPASDRVIIDFGSNTYIKCELINISGDMKSLPLPGSDFTGLQTVDISNLAKGIYIFKAYTSRGEVGFGKIVKN